MVILKMQGICLPLEARCLPPGNQGHDNPLLLHSHQGFLGAGSNHFIIIIQGAIKIQGNHLIFHELNFPFPKRPLHSNGVSIA